MMSHTVKLSVEVKDLDIVQQVCQKKGYQYTAPNANNRLYGGQVAGASVKFPSWTYPVVIAQDGQLHYDNYNGSWGNEKILQEFLHEYSVEKSLNDLSLAGMSAMRQDVVDQSGNLVTELLLLS